jgi:D-arabinose 1-dehydrogenase-like Zn-dependent alcohol dehydrogenase
MGHEYYGVITRVGKGPKGKRIEEDWKDGIICGLTYSVVQRQKFDLT